MNTNPSLLLFQGLPGPAGSSGPPGSVGDPGERVSDVRRPSLSFSKHELEEQLVINVSSVLSFLHPSCRVHLGRLV